MCFVFFNECPEYNIPYVELDDGPNAPLILFIAYTYQVRRAKHGIIPNGPTLCKIFEQNDDYNIGLIKNPTYRKKKKLTKISCYIGKFHKAHHQPILKNYEHHRMLLCLPDKNECKYSRREYV